MACMSAPESMNFIYTLILVIAFIIMLVIIVLLHIPTMVAEKLKYVVQIIWGRIA